MKKEKGFYDTCKSEVELYNFLGTAPVDEIADLIKEIEFRIKHDDPASPLWEYTNVIKAAYEQRSRLVWH